MLGVQATTTEAITATPTIQALVRRYQARKHLPVYLDTETTGLNPRTNKLVSVQLMQPGFAPAVLDWRAANDTWASLLTMALDGCLVVGHNLKFDWEFLVANGVRLTRGYCTQIAEQVLLGLGRSDARGRGIGLHLTDLALRYGALETVSKAERPWFIDLDQRPDEWASPLPPAQVDYAAQDVRVLQSVYDGQQEALRERAHLRPVIALEMGCLPALVAMEMRGIRVDADRWRAFIAEKAQEACEREAEVMVEVGGVIVEQRIEAYDLAHDEWEAATAGLHAHEQFLRQEWETLRAAGDGEGWGDFKRRRVADYRASHPLPARPKLDAAPPNLDSQKQMLGALQALGVPTNTTDSERLKPLEDTYPVVGRVLAYRKATKFTQSFGESILDCIEADGRIHPEYQQIGASTGRMSCTRPNWQQVPSRGDGKRLRACVIASPGSKLLTADFSNIELRILAEVSGDTHLLQMFASGDDLHATVARLMFQLDAAVDPKHTPCPTTPGWTYRDVAKVINYGLVYGMTCVRLARTLKIEKEAAQALMDSYFALFPGVVAWLEQTKRAGVRTLSSRTLSGRTRTYTLPRLPAGASREERRDHAVLVGRIERQAANTPIQGTNADITKLALALLMEDLDPQWGCPVAVVHDEIVVESPDRWVGRTADLLALCMNEAACRYLKTVALPWPEVTIADAWEKA